MSISLYVDGYVSSGVDVNEHFVREGDVLFGTTEIYSCAGKTCVGAAAGYETTSVTTNLAELAASFPDADYFIAGVRAIPALGRKTAGTICADDPTPTHPCVSQSSDTLFEVDFRWVYDLGAGTESSYSGGGEYDTSDVDGMAVLNELRITSYLLNSSPSFTVPDSTGNEIGRIFHTAAELPASITLDCRSHFMEHLGTGADFQLELTAFVRPYYLSGTPVISSEGLMCVL